MVVSNTQLTNYLKRIQDTFPNYTFVQAENFWWAPEKQTIFFAPIKELGDLWTLLHELGHADLGHHTYELDIELLSHECQAWLQAQHLASRFGLHINTEHIENHLDTYRQWMFARSNCPSCGQTGLQTKNTYSCINCKCSWRTNEARICALRRVRLQDQDQIF